MSNEKVYLKGIYFKQGKFGIKASVKVEEFILELRKLQNEKGYVNFDINQRKEIGKFGESHTAILDTWQPQAKNDSTPAAYQSKSKPQTTEDSLPF